MMGLAGRLTITLVTSLAIALSVLGGSLLLNLGHHLVVRSTQEAYVVAHQTARLASAGTNGQVLSLNDPGMLGAAVGRSHLYLQVSSGNQIIQKSNDLGPSILPIRPPQRHPLAWGRLPLWGTASSLVYIGPKKVPAVYARAAVLRRGQVIGYVQAAVSLQSTLQSIQTVATGLIRVGVAVMVIASLLSALFVYRAFGRIRHLSRTAQQVESLQDLGRRIPISGPQDEVWELARSFNHMMDQLEHGFQGQRLITAQASHQLRTPLAAAVGYAAMLKKWGKSDAALVSEGLDVIHEQLQRLERIIAVVLRLAELESTGTEHLVHVDLAQFLRKWQTDVDTPVHLVPGPPVELDLDEDIMAEALNILVDNARRHAGPDATILVGWRAVKGAVEVRVEDDGPGFSPDMLPHAFQPFAKDPASPGSGLGLVLADALVHQQGGRITAENVVPHGARVLITLPGAQ